jgi:hypothetical protein
MGIKSLTSMVNNYPIFFLNRTTTSHLKSLKKDHDMWSWKSRSWLGTGSSFRSLRIFRPKEVYVFYQNNLNFFFPANKTRLTYSIMIKLKINHFKIIINQGFWCHFFQLYLSYIVVVNFIGGGNQRKSQICRNSVTNLIT